MKTAPIAIILALVLSASAQDRQSTPRNAASSRPVGDLILRGTNRPITTPRNISPVSLPDGRVVASVVDTVYMLNPDGSIAWSYVLKGSVQPGTLRSEPAYNPETHEIGVIGDDLMFVRLDAKTGKEKWRASMNGSSEFTQIAPYGQGYLLILDKDALEYRGPTEDDFWATDFPTGAKLIVVGHKFFALTRTKDSVRLQELHPPKHR